MTYPARVNRDGGTNGGFGLVGRCAALVGRVLSRQRSPTPLSWIRRPMEISFARHQFPPDIIRHAVWLYLRFTFSFRDVEDLLAERGVDVS